MTPARAMNAGRTSCRMPDGVVRLFSLIAYIAQQDVAGWSCAWAGWGDADLYGM